MAHIQYVRNVDWDADLSDLGLNETGLVIDGLKTTSGAPTATAGKFAPGAIIQNIVTGVLYANTGTTASPVFGVIDAGAGLVLPATLTDASTTTATSFAQVVSALTTGIARKITAALMTTGIGHQVVAAIAVLTTGRYYSANDGATEVFGIGANGHIHSTVSAVPPTILITAAHGITAVALTAGATDVCGIITSTGTQDNVTDSTFTLTFGKTYTVAPKSIQLTPLNASGAIGSSLPYIVSISATAVVFGVSKSASAGATPSWCYTVIA